MYRVLGKPSLVRGQNMLLNTKTNRHLAFHLKQQYKMFSSGSISGKESVGILGLGKMGRAMALNILDAGYKVNIYDVNTNAVNEVVTKTKKEENVTVCTSPSDLASKSNVLVSMLPNDDVLMKVTTGEGNVVDALPKDSLHIGCSTVSPHTSRFVNSLHQAKGSRYIGAPVFARPDGVEAKQAYFTAGGKEEDIKRAEPILLATGSKVYNFGSDCGNGNVVKLCGNFLIASTIESLAESLALAENNGVDRKALMEMLTTTIFDCLIYKGYGDRVANRKHQPGGFALELGLKDVTLVLDTAHKSNTTMPLGSLLHDRYLTARAKGRAELDWSAIGLNASEDAGVDISKILAENLAAVEEAKKKGM